MGSPYPSFLLMNSPWAPEELQPKYEGSSSASTHHALPYTLTQGTATALKEGSTKRTHDEIHPLSPGVDKAVQVAITGYLQGANKKTVETWLAT